MAYDEEYEVIPTSPMRRMEKRIHKLESTGSSSEVRLLIEQIIELIKSNQRVIDDVIKADAELRNEMSNIPGKIDQLVSNMHEFIEIVKSAGEKELSGVFKGEGMETLTKSIEELVEQNKKTSEATESMLTSLENIDKRLKRTSIGRPAPTHLQYRRPAPTRENPPENR